jgi:Putative auto-transporter adhesin, head GIN domain
MMNQIPNTDTSRDRTNDPATDRMHNEPFLGLRPNTVGLLNADQVLECGKRFVADQLLECPKRSTHSRPSRVQVSWLLISTLLILFGCAGNDPDQTIRLEKLEPFHSIEFNDVFTVYLTDAPEFSVKILAHDNVASQVRLQVKEDTLKIFTDSKRKWLHPETNRVTLHISTNHLSYINAMATCRFETINPIVTNSLLLEMGSPTKLTDVKLELDCNAFMYWNNYLCGGKVSLSGRADNLVLYTFALMQADASNLLSKDAYIENSAKGDCQVWATERLEYSIRSSGNILLKGDPKEIVLREKTSTGRLVRN